MSDLQDQITKAIGAHGLWKTRLRDAVDTGRFTTPLAEVAADDRCEFGKWLHGAALTALRASADYENVVALHARFHEAAAEVANAVTRGDRSGAEARLRGEFADVSAELTSAMMHWKAAG